MTSRIKKPLFWRKISFACLLFARRLMCGVLLLLLSGCGVTTITIEGSYPTPLANKLPLTLGIYYGEEFRHYQHIETNDRNGADLYIVKSGTNQMALFDTMLSGIFERVVWIENLDSLEQYPSIDAIFSPSIDKFWVGFPEETRKEVYEFWVQYNMTLSEPNGNYIHQWKMAAQGKSAAEFFVSANTGMNHAANVALRDLAAVFTLSFSNIPEVNLWLRQNNMLADSFRTLESRRSEPLVLVSIPAALQ